MDAVANAGVEIGIDTGGTFTDVVCFRDGRPVGVTKISSTPSDPSVAILEAVAHLKREWDVSPAEIKRFGHGTTVATNALIERKGGRIGLLATQGFSDVIEIGRQMRRHLYEAPLAPESPVFLAPGRRRKGVIERTASDGSVVIPLDPESVRIAARELVDDGVEAIAICFLFSFLNPAHEIRARDIVSAEFPELMISISSEVDPTFREYERTVVTAFDAYLKPVVDGYLARLTSELKNAGVSSEPKIMRSRGGMSAVTVARQRPVQLFLSGPAAGVVGASTVGKAVEVDDLISIDIGGTSCDIALINAGRPALRSEGKIEGYPVRVNMVDVNTIGAGGGSLVWLDGAGGLHVGPGSAGADPGPACYGRGGDRATVTDASTMLGYLNPEYFAGGSIDIDPQRAYDAIEKTIAEPLGITVERAAQGIHRVVNAQIAEGIRLVSIRRGYDPRRFALVALGGAGPVHATALADELGISKIVVPRNPGVLSATGLLVAPIEHEATISLLRDLADLPPSVVAAALGDTDNQCRSLMAAEGVATSAVEIRHLADVCYVGQSYHLEVQLHMDDRMPLDRLYRDFKDEHDLVHGHATDAPARLVNLRSVHTLGREQDLRFDESDVDRGDSLKGQRSVLFADDEDPWMAAIHERQSLAPAARIEGPAIIEQPDTTTVVTRGWRAVVHTSRNLILEKASTREKLDRNGRL